MSRRGAQSQREEQKRLHRAVRRTGRTPKGLPGSGSKKKVKRFLTGDMMDFGEDSKCICFGPGPNPNCPEHPNGW